MLFDKIANGLDSEMLAFARAIELGVSGRSVAYENPRIDAREFRKSLRQFVFAVFARGVERCRIRIAQTPFHIPIVLHRFPIKIVTAIPPSESPHSTSRL